MFRSFGFRSAFFLLLGGRSSPRVHAQFKPLSGCLWHRSEEGERELGRWSGWQTNLHDIILCKQ